MVNSLTNRPHKTINGKCPYCGTLIGTNFTESDVVKNGRKINMHIICNNYYAVDDVKLIIYPLQEPQNKNSTPYI
jgi:hypothetical protein